MMKKLLNGFVIIVTLFILYKVIMEKVLVYDSINYALGIWVKNLIPTLFPFFIISDILINFNLNEYIPKFLKNICKFLFNINDNMLTILILSIISGFPSNARNTRTLYDKNLITLDEANHILIFSHFSNPLFILTTVSIFFLNDTTVGIILLVSHYLSNLILGILFRNYFVHKDVPLIKDTNNVNFSNVFILSIKRSIDSILMICGIVTIFMLISSIIVSTFNFDLYTSMIIKGILELTIGIEALGMQGIPIVYKAVIASCFLAFGGLSVHMQVISQISGTDIKYRFFLLGRFYQMILAGFITYIIYIPL